MTAKHSESSNKSSPNKLTRKKRRRKRNRSHKIVPDKCAGRRKEQQQRDKQGAPLKQVKGWRLWMFRVICLAVVPVLFFLFLEIVLCIVGYGYPATATIKCKVNGTGAYGDNVKFSWRFFPRNIAQEFDPFIFSADKHSYKPHLLLALSLGRLGCLNEAIDHLLRVTEIKPTSANAYHCLGLAYQAQARIDEAIKYYSMAVRVQPNNSEAYKNLGELLSQQGKIDQAVEISQKGFFSIRLEAV